MITCRENISDELSMCGDSHGPHQEDIKRVTTATSPHASPAPRPVSGRRRGGCTTMGRKRLLKDT